MSLCDVRLALGPILLAAACGGFPRPYTSAELQRDDLHSAGDALVHYLTQSGADSAACAPGSQIFSRFTSEDFDELVRGLEGGEVPPSSWAACAQRLMGGLRGPSLQRAMATLADCFLRDLDTRDDDTPRLLVVNALALALEARPPGTAVPDAAVARLRSELEEGGLGSQIQAIAAHVYEGFEMSRGRYRGAEVSEATMAAMTDAPVLGRFARHLPTEAGRRLARERLVDLAIAASTNEWVRAHAEETKARVVGSGRNALDVATISMVRATDTAAAEEGTIVAQQNVDARTARLLLRRLDETLLLPTLDLRGRLRFEIAHVQDPVTLCGPADALDVAPCIDSAALDVGTPFAALDADGVLHLRDGLSAVELEQLLRGGPELAVSVALGKKRLMEVRWPLRVEAPAPIVYPNGEPLTATVERLGSRIAVTFAPRGSATSLAFVELDDRDAFWITTRGAPGRSGSRGTAGSTGTSGSSGSSASCPSSEGRDGGDGGRGGDGGDGGDGGPGGDGGDIDITLVCGTDCAELERVARALLRSEGGAGGAGGQGGEGGRGGSGGAGGMGTWCHESSLAGSARSHSSHLRSGSRGADGPDGRSGRDGRTGPPGSPGKISIHLQRTTKH